MAKPAKNKKPNVRTDKQGLLRDGPNWPLFILALIGMGLTAYLTFTAWQGKLVAGCTVGSACDVVLNSRWSTLLGMPTSFWGFLTYALLAAIAWNRYADSQWKFAWFVTIVGLLYSLYLTGISFFVLAGRLPLLSDFLGVDDSDFCHLAFSKARQFAPLLLGSLARQDGWHGPRHRCRIASPLCRVSRQSGWS